MYINFILMFILLVYFPSNPVSIVRLTLTLNKDRMKNNPIIGPFYYIFYPYILQG